jgi:hypothetical protein
MGKPGIENAATIMSALKSGQKVRLDETTALLGGSEL